MLNNFYDFVKKLIFRRTIQFNFLISLLFIAMIPIVFINIFYYGQLNQFVLGNTRKYQAEIVRQMGDNMEIVAKQANIAQDQLITITMQNPSFDQENSNELSYIETTRQIDAQMSNIKWSIPNINAMSICRKEKTDSDFNIYSSAGIDRVKFLKQKWLQRDRTNLISMVTAQKSEYFTSVYGEDVYVISFVKFFKTFKGNVENFVQVDMKYSDVTSLIESTNLGEDSLIYMTDREGKLIYFPDKSFLGKDISEIDYKFLKNYTRAQKNNDVDNKYLEVKYRLANLPCEIVALIPTKNLYIEMDKVSRLSLAVLVFAIIFAIVVSYVLAKTITKPIKNIVKQMNKAGRGDFSLLVPKYPMKDLQVLTDGFNGMMSKIDTLMKNIIQKETEKVKAQMIALHSQINSHFLYNTLNSLKWKAIAEGSTKMAETIVALIMILEYTCKKCDQIVLIKDEVDFVNNYVLIQKTRYGDKYQLEWDIQPELYEYGILKIILQPIVENAIVHAFNNLSGIGTIKISASINEEEDVIFEVVDNGGGIGMKIDEKFTGLGMDNVNTRIKLHFGEKYGLSFESILGEGTDVRIKIPLIREGEAECSTF